MVSLLNGIGRLLKSSDTPEVDVPEGQSAMDRAMQAAIEKHAADVAAGKVTSDDSDVDDVREHFGRRGVMSEA